MASMAFTEKCFRTINTDRYFPRTARQHPEIIEMTDEDSRNSTKTDKIDFFRCMGLELSKDCVSNDSNNNDRDTLATVQLRSSASRCSLTPSIAESFVERPKESFSRKSKSKQRHVETKHSSDMTDYLKNILHVRECSVAIIGDKCKICGKNFKCIKDVQIHVKKKHRRKKQKKNLIFKIGDEVISRVTIRSKHLKWRHRTNDRTFVNSENTASLCNEELTDDRGSDEERIPFVDLNSDSDTNDCQSIYNEMATQGNLLQEFKNQTIDKDRKYDDDEEIQVVLRITRPRATGPAMEINHETPNRVERELLITDAIREFVRMDDEPMDINASEDDEKEFDNEISNECCWLADGTLPYTLLDREERNCTFHIENENDIVFNTEDVNLSTNLNNNAYFDDGKQSLHSRKCIDRKYDIIPKSIGNTTIFNDPVSYHRYNNNVYEFDNSFYNDSRVNEWSKLTGVSEAINCDGQCMNTFVGPSVLIKEEIMLDDLL